MRGIRESRSCPCFSEWGLSPLTERGFIRKGIFPQKTESLARSVLVAEEHVSIDPVQEKKTREIRVILAADEGELEEVKEELKAGPVSKRARGAAVIAAAQRGHAEVIKVLLKGGKISSQDIMWVVEFTEGEKTDCVIDALCTKPELVG
jgi:hypothetical protein